MAVTGLSADPKEYRQRLAEQSDEQIDAWAAELMRDVAKRRGVLRVLGDLKKAARLSEADIERSFASGSGPMASIGRDAQGRQMIHQGWWVLTFPLIVLFVTVLAFNQLGDGLRRAVDPMMRR